MGSVKDRYLKHASDGDQYIGCFENCADHNSAEFAVSPPYFDFSFFEMADRIVHKKELDDFISNCLYQLTDNDDDGHVKYISKILFASLCHHH